jgi:hypothetical protein
MRGGSQVRGRAKLIGRNERIAAAVKRGETFELIGARYDLSRERVRQIATALGAKSKRAKDLIRAEQAKRLSARKAAARAQHAKRAKVAHLMLELVKAGCSIAAAGRLLGLTQGKTQHISKQLGLGAITQHGRWRAGDR